jgi:hypothetical protein
MTVTLVPTEHVGAVWEKLRPHADLAAEYTYGRFDADDIRDAIEHYDHNLWLAYEGDDIKGIVVTTFKQYPKKKFLDLTFVGGEEGFDWKTPMLKLLQHWAYDNQCDGIESSGRLGWSKVFKDDGYKPLWQTYELPIAATGLGDQ